VAIGKGAASPAGNIERKSTSSSSLLRESRPFATAERGIVSCGVPVLNELAWLLRVTEPDRTTWRRT
jgi:hypothetical protein